MSEGAGEAAVPKPASVILDAADRVNIGKSKEGDHLSKWSECLPAKGHDSVIKGSAKQHPRQDDQETTCR